MTDSTEQSEPSGRKRSLAPGIILIAFGLFFFAVNNLRIDFSNIWPAMLLIPVAILVTFYLRDRRQYGMLMPATILTVYAVLFFVCQIYDWDLMSRLWPTFILAPGLGLFVMYLAGRREPGFLIPAVILTGLSAIFFIMMNGFPEYWPAIFILIGIIILLRPGIWGRSTSGDQKTSPGN